MKLDCIESCPVLDFGAVRVSSKATPEWNPLPRSVRAAPGRQALDTITTKEKGRAATVVASGPCYSVSWTRVLFCLFGQVCVCVGHFVESGSPRKGEAEDSPQGRERNKAHGQSNLSNTNSRYTVFLLRKWNKCQDEEDTFTGTVKCGLQNQIGLIPASPGALGWLPKLSELLPKTWHIVSA